MSYQCDRAWSDQFIPDISTKVGPMLLKPTTFQQDACEASDLIVLHAKDMRIAARIRRHGYADKYPFDFTIRSHRDTGSVTEMQKIMRGFGDWFFYGHAEVAGSTVSSWMVIDLHAFRYQLIRYGFQLDTENQGWSRLVRKKDNKDGTAFFVFDARQFPDCVIGGNVPVRKVERAA